MLNDIAQVPGWSKVNRGLFKMYIGEVLSKRVIVQHLLFGSVITLEPKLMNEPVLNQ
jgi:serine/threonine-protein phosphatase 2A activator